MRQEEAGQLQVHDTQLGTQENAPLQSASAYSIPNQGFVCIRPRTRRSLSGSMPSCERCKCNLRQVEVGNCSQMYILKLRTNTLLSLTLGDDKTEVWQRRGKSYPRFRRVHPQPLNLEIKHVTSPLPETSHPTPTTTMLQFQFHPSIR